MSDTSFIRESWKNNKLIHTLQMLDTANSQELPEWKRMLLLGGLLSDAIRALKDKYPDWNYDEIEQVIAGAIEYYLFAVMKDELNAAWDEWERNTTGKYADVKTIEDMYAVQDARIEQTYPGFMNWFKRCFHMEESD